MKDYGRPVGWWCPECTLSPLLRGNGDVYALTHEAHCQMAVGIPVFEPLPANKREEADEPEEDAVIEIIDVDGMRRLCLSWDRGNFGDGIGGERHCFVGRLSKTWLIDGHMRLDSLAGAILAVVYE